MKILWWATASPFAPTGYGRVSYYMAKQLERLGHEVHVFCANGLSNGRLNVDGLRLYPNPRIATLGDQFMVRLYEELGADVVVWMGDFWPFADTMRKAGEQVPLVLHSPIDHFPVTIPEVECAKAARVLATLCPTSVKWAEDAGLTNVFLAPHGCNLETFKPYNRLGARAKLGWPVDRFIFLSVAANRGDRKNHYGLLNAYNKLLTRRPELRRSTMLALHTYPYRDRLNEEGYDVWNIAASLDLLNNIIFPDALAYLEGVPEPTMALMYQAADVHVLPSKTEGFGLPIIEAGACGLPTIGTRFGSIPDIIPEPAGWFVDVADMEVQQLVGYSWQAIPSTDHLSTIMEHVCDHPLEVAGHGHRMMEHVNANYSWEKAASYWPAILHKAVAARLETDITSAP